MPRTIIMSVQAPAAPRGEARQSEEGDAAHARDFPGPDRHPGFGLVRPGEGGQGVILGDRADTALDGDPAVVAACRAHPNVRQNTFFERRVNISRIVAVDVDTPSRPKV